MRAPAVSRTVALSVTADPIAPAVTLPPSIEIDATAAIPGGPGPAGGAVLESFPQPITSDIAAKTAKRARFGRRGTKDPFYNQVEELAASGEAARAMKHWHARSPVHPTNGAIL